MLWRRAEAARVGCWAAVAAAALIVVSVVTAGSAPGFDGSAAGVATVDVSTRAGAAVARGDGMYFDALARDPLLRRPGVFREGAGEAAYRAQRPLYGWAAWLLSGGRAGLVSWVLLLLGVPSAFFAAAGLAVLLERRQAARWWAVVAVLLPGGLCALGWGCADVAALAFAVWAVVWWSDGRYGPAVAACMAGALCRETMLLVPAALVAWSLLVERESWRRLWWRAAVPAAVYAGWVLVVRWRFGSWPVGGGEARLGLPFDGLSALAAGVRTVDVLSLAVLALAVLGVWRSPRHPAAAVTVAFLASAALFGPAVWTDWVGFARVLLPAAAFGLVLAAPRADQVTFSYTYANAAVSSSMANRTEPRCQ